MIKWAQLFRSNSFLLIYLENFVDRNISGRQLLQNIRNGCSAECFTLFGRLLREYGVDELRERARKALCRQRCSL